MPDRSFESQRWAAGLEGEAMDRKIRSSERFGEQVSAGVESFNRQANASRDREQRQGMFDAGQEQQQQQFEQRESRMEKQFEQSVEMQTQKFALEKLRIAQAERRLDNMEAQYQLERREAERRAEMAELLQRRQQADFDMDMMERQQAFQARANDIRHNELARQAERMAGSSSQDVTAWIQSPGVQRLLAGEDQDQVGPIPQQDGTEARQMVASARNQNAQRMVGRLLSRMDPMDPDRFEVAAIGTGLADGSLSAEDATNKLRALYRRDEANKMDANPVQPEEIERAVSALSEDEKSVYDRFTNLPFGPGSQIKVAKWLADPRNMEDMMAFLTMSQEQGREIDPKSPEARDVVVDWFNRQMRPGAPHYQALMRTLSDPRLGGVLKADDMAEHARMMQAGHERAREVFGNQQRIGPMDF